MRATSLGVCFIASIVIAPFAAMAWIGPSQPPTSGNVAAPINVGISAQTKNGTLGVNGLAVFGNSLLSGSDRYLNWGSTAGLSGYGIRDLSGTLQFKNLGGNWESLQTIVNNYMTLSGGGSQWTSSGPNIYYNTGNVGIGTTMPTTQFTLANNASHAQLRIDSADGFDDNIIFSEGAVVRWYLGNIGSDDTFRLRDISANTILAANSSGNVGIGTVSPGQKLHVNGTVLATAFLYSSDARLKEGVATLKDSLAKVLALSPVSFTWKKDIESANAGKDDIGFIAQDVEKIVPDIVHTDSDGMKSIDYIKLVPVLTKAIQEQQTKIEELETLVNNQQRRIQSLEAKLTLPRQPPTTSPPTDFPSTGTDLVIDPTTEEYRRAGRPL